MFAGNGVGTDWRMIGINVSAEKESATGQPYQHMRQGDALCREDGRVNLTPKP